MADSPLRFRVRRALGAFAVVGGVSSALLSQDVPAPLPPSVDEAELALRTGNYGEARDRANAAIEAGARAANWFEILVRAHLALGALEAAREAAELAVEDNPWEIGLLLVAHEAYQRAGHEIEAVRALEEIERRVSRQPWNYDGAEDRVVLGRSLLLRGVDPKEVLDELYFPARRLEPEQVAVHLAIGELALAKEDFALAAESLQTALELDPEDPWIHYLLARAFRPSDGARAAAFLEQALEINSRHAPSLLEWIDVLMSEERYDEVKTTLVALLDVDSHRWEAWAYRAALAHLRGDYEAELRWRERAFEPWRNNPGVDHQIGRELSEHYRFAEGARHQRLALAVDSEHRAARFQLAQDLLRMGQDEEGWKLAESVADEDPYHVVAYNWMTLFETIRDYETLEVDGFVVRMRPLEAAVYGDAVLGLLRRARESLCPKYDVSIDGPIVVEIFERQEDFAIRTFGIPGGDGYLGVCFGSLITMNGPATRWDSPADWQAVLWHEFTHAVTLHKTRNRMPRWLSEGISVYEEEQVNPAWGRAMTPAHRDWILAGRATPVSALSSAFLRPQGPFGIEFAYYQSARVVEFLVERDGMQTLLNLLDDLGAGIPVHVAMADRFAPSETLDAEFAEVLRQRALDYGPVEHFAEIEGLETSDRPTLLSLLDQHPDHVPLLLRCARTLVDDDLVAEAVPLLEHALRLCPSFVQGDHAYRILADAYRHAAFSDRELETIERWIELDADSLEARLRAMELATAAQDWETARRFCESALAIQPLLPELHRRRIGIARELGRHEAALASSRALLALGTEELADTHYECALALRALGRVAEARREVLRAIEEAPRFRAAHRLLLELVQIEEKAGDSAQEGEAPPTSDSKGNQDVR